MEFVERGDRERLRDVLEQSAEALESGAIVAVEDDRHRVRHLPP
jgi:hypothetical protein